MDILNLDPLLASKDKKNYLYTYLSFYCYFFFSMYKKSIEKRGKDGFFMLTGKKKSLKFTRKVRNKTKQNKTSYNNWNNKI